MLSSSELYKIIFPKFAYKEFTVMLIEEKIPNCCRSYQYIWSKSFNSECSIICDPYLINLPFLFKHPMIFNVYGLYLNFITDSCIMI